jgi:hypothetical protein
VPPNGHRERHQSHHHYKNQMDQQKKVKDRDRFDLTLESRGIDKEEDFPLGDHR